MLHDTLFYRFPCVIPTSLVRYGVPKLHWYPKWIMMNLRSNVNKWPQMIVRTTSQGTVLVKRVDA